MKIEFTLGSKQKVILAIYDMNGQLIKTLADRTMESGDYQFAWNSVNQFGGHVKQGVYIIKLITADDTYQKTVVKTF